MNEVYWVPSQSNKRDLYISQVLTAMVHSKTELNRILQFQMELI